MPDDHALPVIVGQGITLSRRQLKAARRLPGIELMLPWPAALPAPNAGRRFERAATAAEKTVAIRQVAEAIVAERLVVRAVRVVVEESPIGHVLRPYLVVEIGDPRFGVDSRRHIHPVTCWLDSD